MSKNIPLIKLNYSLMRPYKNSIFFLMLLGVLMGAFFKSALTVESYFVMSLILMMTYPFAIDDKNELDTLYGTLPVSKNNIVAGRYLFIVVSEAVCLLISLVFAAILSIALNIEFILQDNLFALCVLSFVFSAVVSLQYPTFFKLGYNKAKIKAMLPTFIIFFGAMIAFQVIQRFEIEISLEGILSAVSGNPLLMYVLPLAAGLLCLLVSYKVSLRMYKKREI